MTDHTDRAEELNLDDLRNSLRESLKEARLAGPHTSRLLDAIPKLLDRCAEREAEKATIADYEEVLADKRRLAREIDVAMHGEDKAAEQPSLCDLVHSAGVLRARAEAAEARADELEREKNRQEALYSDDVNNLKAEHAEELRAAEAELERLRRIEAAANHAFWVKPEKLDKWKRGQADPQKSCSSYTPDWIELGEALLAPQPQEASEGQEGDRD